MRTSSSLYLILGLISAVYALPYTNAPGAISARGSTSTKGYVVTYSPDGHAKSEEEYKKIDDGIVGLINEARKAMKIDGEIDKSQVKFINFPVTADSKFYFTFTGPMCGKGKCVARGMDFEKPTENALVLGSKKQKLYAQGTPPGEFKPVYKVTYSPAGSKMFSPDQYQPVDKNVLALIQKAREKLNIKAEVKFEEVQFTNLPPSVTEGELSFTFTGPMCGKTGGVCKAKAKDLKDATQNAVIEGAKGNVLFKSGTPPSGSSSTSSTSSTAPSA